jgi:WD40 repeat protein
VKRIAIGAVILGWGLVFTVCSAADVVTTPLRTYGLGDLLQAAISPDGRWMATSGSSGAFIWDFSSGTLRHRLEGNRARVIALCFSPDSGVLLTAGYDSVVDAWDVESGTKLRSFEGHQGAILDLAFSPGGQTFASVADTTARVWSLGTGQLLNNIQVPGAFILRAMFTPDGNRLVTVDGAFDGSPDHIQLWDLATEQMIRRFGDHLAFSPATGDLYVAWADGVLRLFNPVTGEVKLDSIAPSGFPGAAAFSPDGRFILGAEGFPSFTARLWDARTGEVLREFFSGHNAPVTSVAFNKSGTSILTGSDIVRLWSIADIAARLESEHRPNSLELRWSAGTLQHSTHVNGPWVDVTDAASPWSIATDQPSRFYRVQALADE